MVRGLCPLDRIRGAVDGCGRTVGNAGASGHAERPQPVNRGRRATQWQVRRWGGAQNTTPPVGRRREWAGRLPRAIDAVRRPTAAHRGRCALRRVGNVSALQIRHPLSNGRGVGDAAPYGLCDRVHFCGAVRWAGSLGVVFHIRCVICRKPGYAAARRVHRPRCTMVT